jgi:hypothetical protein
MAAPFMQARKINQSNPMAVYSGKYGMTVNGKTGYIQISPKDDHLVLHETWSGNNFDLKHLSADNFVMDVTGWAIHFNRDKAKAVVSVEVKRTDLWTKVK